MIAYMTSVHTQIGVVSMGSRGGKGKDVEDATNSWNKTKKRTKRSLILRTNLYVIAFSTNSHKSLSTLQ